MAVYAIGDVQGCYDELLRLLEQIRFDPAKDTLWFTGDLVNRGPASLQVLRRVREWGDSAITVLGNHDLHLLAVAEGCAPFHKSDTLDEILNAPDRDELLHWLRQQPLLHHDVRMHYTLVHAGLPPQWDLVLAQACAREVEQVLRGDDYAEFLRHMYGDQPDQWREDLQGWGRLRFIANCLTRLRYCNAEGRLNLRAKGEPGTQPEGDMPWFEVPGRRSADLRVVFGHWSTLGLYRSPKVISLDTGCLWGNQLTAVHLAADGAVYAVDCAGHRHPGAA
ncbi:MAG TPA: symmetrical bis(5'-nucleosyl)-tetraphosphatase [Gammaproteobacteria bacterium]|nr:symmetrical bis(5'-nucleosyl)-tetraphosphatase [Gammaproteobacteria bacterium]